VKEDINQIAFFDFDGTITRKDTLFEIIKFLHGKSHFYLGILSLLPTLVLFKLRIISNWKAKEKMFTWFFNGLSHDTFQQYCNQFALDVLPKLVRTDALKALEDLRDEGTRIVIVSASAENWISAWCIKHDIEYIGTKLEVKKGKLTGKIDGLNCYGEEKVNRIKAIIDLSSYTRIYAYGDSKGDSAMLKLASDPFYRIFKT
jgi:HAD superfamily hydrolase (TIGR01490 family)